MVAAGLTSLEAVAAAFEAIRSALERYPRLDARAFEERVARFTGR